jgi:hypothetical protein
MSRATVRRALALVCAIAAAAGATACSALLDWSGFTGGAAADAEAGSPGDGGDANDEPDVPVVACTGASTCAPTLPTGWTGPLALYVGLPDAGAEPGCPSGFAQAPVFEGSGSLVADPAQCSTCTCGPASGVTCADPVMTLYVDPFCMQSIGSPAPVSSACTPTMLGAFSLTLGGPLPTGGACTPSGSTPTISTPTWGTIARACAPAMPALCPTGAPCAPLPSAPYSPRLCVMEKGSASSCPPAYSFGPQVFYTGVSDARGCAPCSCATPTGGTCTIGSPAVDEYKDLGCSTVTAMIDAPSGCTAVTGPDPVQLVSAPMLSAPGSCVAGGGDSVGAATPTGAMSFCCTP